MPSHFSPSISTSSTAPSASREADALAALSRLQPKSWAILSKGLATTVRKYRAIRVAIASRLGTEPVHACVFEGAHVDAGTPAGMLAAAMFRAQEEPGLYASVEKMLQAARAGATQPA